MNKLISLIRISKFPECVSFQINKWAWPQAIQGLFYLKVYETVDANYFSQSFILYNWAILVLFPVSYHENEKLSPILSNLLENTKQNKRATVSSAGLCHTLHWLALSSQYSFIYLVISFLIGCYMPSKLDIKYT